MQIACSTHSSTDKELAALLSNAVNVGNRQRNNHFKTQIESETKDFSKKLTKLILSDKSEKKVEKKAKELKDEIKERLKYYKKVNVSADGLSRLYSQLASLREKLNTEHTTQEITGEQPNTVRQVTDNVRVETDANGEETLCVEIDLDKEGLRYDQVMARHAAEQSRAADIVDAEDTSAAPATIFPYQEYLAMGLSLMDEPAKSKNYFRRIVEEYRTKAQMLWADWVEDKVQAAEAAQQVQAIRDELQAFQKEAEAMNLNTKIWRTELNFRFMDDLLSALKQGSKQFVNTKAARNPAMADAMQRAGIKKV